MNRRDVITLLGGAVTLPHAARAQQPGRIRRVGVLMGIAESDPEQQAFVSAFTRGLRIQAGARGATSGSIIAGAPATAIASAASHTSWSSCSRT
jgi:hypothetical protein